jgi:hypothetical protein
MNEMEDIEFRPARGFRISVLVRACVALVLAAIFLTLTEVSPAYGLIAVFPGFVAACLLVSYASSRRFRTRLTAQGIESRRYRTRFVPWGSVRNIETVSWERIADVPVIGNRAAGRPASRRGGANRKVATVRIQKADGHWLELAVPVVTGRDSDPDFTDKVRLIRDRWRAAIGRAPVP